MPIRLIVLREDARAEAVLADVAGRLGVSALEPDEHGDVYVVVEDGTDADAWQRVREALDAAGDDWWAYVHLPPHRAAQPGPER